MYGYREKEPGGPQDPWSYWRACPPLPRRHGSSVIAFLCFSTKEPFCPLSGPSTPWSSTCHPAPLPRPSRAQWSVQPWQQEHRPGLHLGVAPVLALKLGTETWSQFSHQDSSLSYSERPIWLPVPSPGHGTLRGERGPLPERLMAGHQGDQEVHCCAWFSTLYKGRPQPSPPQRSQRGHTQPHCPQAVPYLAGTEDDIQVIAGQVSCV